MTNEELDNQDKKNDNKDSEDSTVSEAALGLIMLQEHDPTGNSLLQKYDNSSLLPVDAARQVDYSINPDTELADNDKDTSHDSDDTIVLQQEIEDTIGETTNNHNTNTPSPTKTWHDTDLPVETTGNNATLDTSSITKGLSNLVVSPSSVPQTPVSPNKGTVVFKSYRLHLCAANTDNETSSRPTSANTAKRPNSENDIQLARIASGNSMRPPTSQTNTKLGNFRSIRWDTTPVCIATSTLNRYTSSITITDGTIHLFRVMFVIKCRGGAGTVGNAPSSG